MDILTVLVLVAVAGAMFSLASGVTAMARGGVVAHYDSAHWMVWRVAFQGAALVLMLLALLAPR
jgi:hypothetical protein